MEGAPKRQSNPEEMLAELKRVLESSLNAPAPAASTAAKSNSSGGGIGRSQIDKGSDRPAEAYPGKSIGPRTDLLKATGPRAPSRKLRAGGFALGGAAVFFAGAALMNQILNRPAHEFSAAATDGLARPQDEQTLQPPSPPRAPVKDTQQAAPLQAGALETRPEAGAAPVTGGTLPVLGKAEGDAPHIASPSLESAAPAFAPALLNQAPALAPSVRIGPDGAPIATAPSTPAPTDSGRQAAPPNLAAAPAASQTVKPHEAPMPTAPSTPASTESARQAETPNRAAAPAASQMVKPHEAPIATPPPAPASTASAPPAETPSGAAAPPASQKVKPDEARIATAPPAPASTDSTPPAETPKPNATPTAHVSNESTQPSIRKADSKKRPLEKTSAQKPLRSPTPPVKSIAHAERQRTEPAQPKEAELSPKPTQNAGNPAQAAPVAAPSVQQRFADGVTHAFGYLVHLPGALVPHLGGANPDAH